LYIPIGGWNIKEAVENGKAETMTRFFFRICEEAEQLLRQMQANGQNATQVTLIFDLSNYVVEEHACATCADVLVSFLTASDTHYPDLDHRLYAVNTPAGSRETQKKVFPRLSQHIKDIIKVYGTDQSTWKLINEEIDVDQRTKELGGTRPMSQHISELTDQIAETGQPFRCNNEEEIKKRIVGSGSGTKAVLIPENDNVEAADQPLVAGRYFDYDHGYDILGDYFDYVY